MLLKHSIITVLLMLLISPLKSSAQNTNDFSGEWSLDYFITTLPGGENKNEFISKEFSDISKRSLKIAEDKIEFTTPCNQGSFEIEKDEDNEMEFTNYLNTKLTCDGRATYWERMIVQSWKNFTKYEIVNNTLKIYCGLDNNNAIFVYNKLAKK